MKDPIVKDIKTPKGYRFTAINVREKDFVRIYFEKERIEKKWRHIVVRNVESALKD